MAPAYAPALRQEAEEVRQVLRRAVVFRGQLTAWVATGRTGIPLLVLTEAPAPRLGACVSCGGVISTGWRCPVCLLAVYVALGAVPPRTEGVTGNRGE